MIGYRLRSKIGGLLALCRLELERVVTARGVVADLAGAYPADVTMSAGGTVPALPHGEGTAFAEQVLAGPWLTR